MQLKETKRAPSFNVALLLLTPLDWSSEFFLKKLYWSLKFYFAQLCFYA